IAYGVAVALPLFGAFVFGLGARRWLQRHVALLVRLQLAGGMAVLAVLSGWSFELSVGNVMAIGVVLCGQLAAVALAARLFARRTDGALIAFWMYGNPTFWTAPVAAATLGAHAAVFVIAYDMLTQSRIAGGIKCLRHRAPKPQSPRTALTDYAPALGAVAGLLLGLVLPAPDVIATVVAALGSAMAAVAALLLGVSWPKRWIGRPQVALTLRGLALHLTVLPATLAVATLAGVALPGVVWLLALGPIPLSVVSFAQRLLPAHRGDRVGAQHRHGDRAP